MTTERIATDPVVMMGKHVIRGTRITVELVQKLIRQADYCRFAGRFDRLLPRPFSSS